MFLLNKKNGIHKKLQKLMQLMKAELYKLKKSSIHNVQTVMHLRILYLIRAHFYRQMLSLFVNTK